MTSTRTWHPDDPALTALPASDRDFLTGTGLTTGTFAYLDVVPDPEPSPDGVVLAYDSGTPIVCTAAGVVAAEPHGPRVVSTSVAAFVASMHRMARYSEDVRAADDEDAELAVVHAAVADLRAIDPAAWADDTAYWPVVAEQMVAGML